MGAAAALIPGIVGIGAGEYMKRQEAEKGREMQARQASAIGRFIDPASDVAGNTPFGTRGPMPANPNVMGGEATRRAQAAQSPQGTMARFAREMLAAGNAAPANALVQQRFAPERAEADYGNAPQEGINPETGQPEQYLIDKRTGRQVWLGTKPVPKTEKPSDYVIRFNDWKSRNPNGTMMQFDATQAALGREPKEPKSTFDDEGKLRGEFDKKTQDFTIVRDAYSNISTVASDASPAGDLSLIFSYMKLLDPGSTVREGEYATAQNAASVPETIRAKFNKAIEGETLTPSQRADFVKQAGNIYASKKKSFDAELSRYQGLAKQYGLDPTKIVYDRTNGLQQPGSANRMSDPGFDFSQFGAEAKGNVYNPKTKRFE
jgi:hypothetical protein